MGRLDDADSTAVDILSLLLSNCKIIPENDNDEIISQFVLESDLYFSVKKPDGRIKKVLFNEVPKELIYVFYAKIAQENFVDFEMKTSFHFKKANEESISKLNRMLRKFRTPRGLKLPPSKKKQIEEILVQLKDCNVGDSNYEMKLSKLSEFLCIENILKMRKNQLISLKERIHCWNRISDNKSPMKVVNDYDLEILPDIKYVNACQLAADLDQNSGARGCKCDVLCSSPECTCISLNSIEPPYTRGKLSDEFLKTKGKNQYYFTSPIYECNEYCACPKTCSNKTTQNGSDVKFLLFRTFNECGWGLQTAADLEPGTFILRYPGEIITFGELENRDCTYCFGLDYDDGKKKCDFIIDAKYVGNIGRFVNHSCQPNLGIVSVFTKHREMGLHEISFFAVQHINAGDQLTINYGDKYELECSCNQKHCRH